MSSLKNLFAVLGGVLLLAGCGADGPATPFQGDPTSAPFSQPSATRLEGPYCKSASATSYQSSANPIDLNGKDPSGFYFAMGGGCLERPLKELWAVLHNKLSVKWKDADLVSFSLVPHPEVNFLFQAAYAAGPFFARQPWVIEWYQTLKSGTLEHPEHLIVHYSKVSGTSHLPHWKGSIELLALDENTTSFAMRNEIRGTHINEEKAAGGILDILHNLKVTEPNWSHFQNALAPATFPAEK